MISMIPGGAYISFRGQPIKGGVSKRDGLSDFGRLSCEW
jgi:hypothetical protein